MIWRCVICLVFISFSLTLLLSHINRMHSRSPDFRLLCSIDGCTEEYRVYNSFYHHVKRRHSQHLLERARTGDGNHTGEHSQEQSQDPLQQQDSSIASQALCTTNTDGEMDVNQDRPATVQPDLTKQATAFVINARAKHRLSQKGMNDIVAGVQQYQSSLLSHLRSQMEQVLQKHSDSTSGHLQEAVMDIFDSFVDPFTTVATTYRQNSVMKKQLSILDAEEIPISQTACKRKHGALKEFFIKDKAFHYIPLVKSLEQFLLHPKIFCMIETGPQRCKEGFFYDIVDGSLLKSHPLFSKIPNALQIVLYTDEMEICNPLGSFTTKNKLLMVYYTLANINPKYRSKLAAIRLLAMARSVDLRHFGVNVILNRIKEDMDALYIGVKMQTINGEKTIYGAMVSVCGDTLAQHELAGFKEGVGFAYSKCRHCECSFEDMQSLFNEDAFTKRTLKRHIRQIDEIEKADTELLRNSLKTTYGINKRSKLVEFPAFDIIQQTPQDIMHIILGIVFAPVLTIATVSRLKSLIENHLKDQNQIYESSQNVNPSTHPISSNEKEMGPVSKVKDLQYLQGKLRDFLGYDKVTHAVSAKWLVINGSKYITQKSMILVKVVNSNMPEFGLIKNIYLVDSMLYCLEYQPFQTIHFDRNVMAYQVDIPHLAQGTELVDADKLVDFTSYYTIRSESQTFVQVKYYLGDVIDL